MLDKLLSPVTPRICPDSTASLEDLADGVWQAERQIKFPVGMRLPVRMTLLRLEDGSLLVHSPIQVNDETYEAVDALGEVSAIVAPNSFHHSFAAGWIERYPDAEFFVAPGLSERSVDIPPATELTEKPPAIWRGTLEQVIIREDDSFSEVVFFHRPSRTLVLTDLAFNGVPGDSWWQRVSWRIFGIAPRFGPSRSIRWTLLHWLDTLPSLLARILEWEFERITVAHGPPVLDDARETVRRGFAAYIDPSALPQR